jgi:hypothetical protein
MIKPKEPLSNERVKDITFFEEDINELNSQLRADEGLYKDFFGIYKELTGGKYSNLKSVRDIAEVAKALVQLRSLCSDTTYKRHLVRKNLSDIVFRSSGGDVTADEIIKETARTIISEVRNYSSKEDIDFNNSGRSEKIISDEERMELNSKVRKYIDSGDISLSTNDKLIGISDFVEFKFDQKRDDFIAVDNRSGNEIIDFPRDRLPEKKISRRTRDEVVTSTGDRYDVIGDD